METVVSYIGGKSIAPSNGVYSLNHPLIPVKQTGR
jgi:hypothetical protein